MLLAMLVLLSSFLLGNAVAKRLNKSELFPSSILFGTILFTWIYFIMGNILGLGGITLAITILLSFIFSLVISFWGAWDKSRSLRFQIFNNVHLNSLFEKDSIAVFIISFLLIGYSASTAISLKDGFSVATQDFALHLGIISTISNGNFPPLYPNYLEQNLTYYYFPHLFASALVIGGLDAIFSFQILLSLVIASFIAAFYCITRDLLSSKYGAILAIFLMFIVSPCTGCQHGGASWFSPFYPPDAAKMLISGPKGFPFAPTMLSFPFSQLPMAFGFLFFAISARFLMDAANWKNAKAEKWKILLFGFLLGLLPMFHAFIYLVLIGILALFVLWKRSIEFANAFGAALILGAMQFLFFLSDKAQNTFASNFLHFEMFAYSQSILDLLMFWFLNAGGHIILAIIGLFYLSKKNNQLPLITTGAFLVFLLGNFFILTPYRWDSNKLFLPFLLIVPIFSAAGMLWLWKKQLITKIIFCLIILLAIASSYYHFFIFFNPQYAQTPVKLSTPEILSACEWVAKNTHTDSIFLSDPTLEGGSCLYAYSGRLVFLSVPFWVETHGFNKEKVLQEQSEILNGDLSLAKKYGITHLFSDAALEGRISDELRENLKPVYSAGQVTIYELE